jgi:chromosomal replication initiator protein
VQGGRTDSCQLDDSKIAAPLEAAWDSIRTGLRRDLGARTFDGWLKPALLGDFDPDSGTLDLVMPSQFMADWVRSHFGERLALAWKTTLPVVRDVRIVTTADAPRPAPLLVLEDAPARAERDPSAPNFDPRYRFESFVIGKANEVAATAARTLATRSASTLCSFTAVPGAARRIFCTRSATPSVSDIRRPGSCRCRPRSSWSSSSAR